MSDFGAELARLMAARGTGVRELARAVPCNAGHISNLKNGTARPSEKLAAALDTVLGADGALLALVAPAPRRAAVLPADDESAALDLARRAEASDTGEGTVARLELAFDDLAIAYQATPPDVLLTRVRSHLDYVSGLIGGRATLTQHRRLLVTGGWLSLLAATCLIDLHRDAAAESFLRTSAQLARETEHAEIAAWVLETRAWQVLTIGNYPKAAELSRSAQSVAPRHGSAYIQATAQEGRAWARMGDRAATTAVLTRVEHLVSALPLPEDPEHHYRYDPAKAESYIATTLAWSGDPAAEQVARDVLARLESPVYGPPRLRRATSARLDLSLALVAGGKHDEATGTALTAVTSGLLVPSNYWRAAEIISAVAERGVPEAIGLAEAYREAYATGDNV